MRGVVLLKLGGSLLTDKSREDTDHPEIISRLAQEIAAALAGPQPPPLVVGHGSGSFGHAAAARSGIAAGLGSSERLRGVVETRERAVELHRRVVAALAEAGALPYSISPSSALVTAAGKGESFFLEPLQRALDAGLLPVVYGDVVMDRAQGAAIASTETVFLALADAGLPIARALWAGVTDGVLDDAGETIAHIRVGASREAEAAAGASAATDVTGGMRHRLAAVLELAVRGVESVLFDGRVPGRLGAVLKGEAVPGTRVDGVDSGRNGLSGHGPRPF
ncbi:MAG: isopentenyl phosphate kinase [Thermoanaerobaculia bacterium]|nr:isopentenyl phosphate kinase [Thermoanaerobaculia bacterium]